MKTLDCRVNLKQNSNPFLPIEPVQVECDDNRSCINGCDETCPSFYLCRKRILIVGGINRMEFLYRQLIEKNGGIFEYHNGHIKGGKRELEDRVRRADIVLCPVNINSHNACSVVKQMGKKHRKSVRMLAGSGLGTISQALLESQKGASIQ